MSTAQRRFYSEIFQEYFDRGLAEGEAKGRAEGRAEGEAKGRAEGRAEGEAQGELRGKIDLLLKLLALKNFSLTDADRARILGCTDTELLDTWAARVLTANDLRDVLGE